MLACARIGAIHSVVFGGFAAASLATRIDDAKPKVMVTADAGMRGGKAVPYKHLVDEAMPAREASAGARHHRRPRPRSRRWRARRAATSTTRRCARSIIGRAGAVRVARVVASRRTSSTRRARPASRRACSATPAATPSRSPRRCATSSASRPARRCSRPATSAGSSVTRTSSTRRCINGSTTIMYEGLPIRPDPGDLVEDRRRARREDDVQLADGDPRAEEAGPGVHEAARPVDAASTCSSPASRSTSRPRAGRAMRSASRSSTTTGRRKRGWPILSAQPGVEDTPRKFGSPVVSRLRLRRAAACDEATGARRRRPTRRAC